MAKAKNPTETVRRVADAVMAGKMSQTQGAKKLGISQAALSNWMTRHGYSSKMHFIQRIEPTERDIKALREYWRRDCNQQELREFTGRSYPVVKRWIDAKIGKEGE